MKNVLGEEVPLDTPEQKVQFYDRDIQSFTEPWSPEHRTQSGKDTFLQDWLIPWGLTEGIKSVVDIGAGNGKYSFWMYEAWNLERALAVEISTRKTEMLQEMFTDRQVNIEALHLGVELSPIPGSWDLVFASDVIEHFVDYRKGWSNLLDAGRYVYTLVPYCNSFNWSEDHLHRFDSKRIDELIEMSNGLVKEDIVESSVPGNNWAALLVKGGT